MGFRVIVPLKYIDRIWFFWDLLVVYPRAIRYLLKGNFICLYVTQINPDVNLKPQTLDREA